MSAESTTTSAVIELRSVANSRPPGAWFLWEPLHGGSGVTTLSRAVPIGAELPIAERPWMPRLTIVRSHAAGLVAAQAHAASWDVHDRELQLGLVVVADAPGRLPRPLERTLRTTAGVYPQLWRIPFVQTWRLGVPPTRDNTPQPARDLLAALIARLEIDISKEQPS